MHRHTEVGFLLRLWHEPNNHAAWRGYIQDIEGTTGTYFNDLNELLVFIREYLLTLEREGTEHNGR